MRAGGPLFAQGSAHSPAPRLIDPRNFNILATIYVPAASNQQIAYRPRALVRRSFPGSRDPPSPAPRDSSEGRRAFREGRPEEPRTGGISIRARNWPRVRGPATLRDRLSIALAGGDPIGPALNHHPRRAKIIRRGRQSRFRRREFPSRASLKFSL